MNLEEKEEIERSKLKMEKANRQLLIIGIISIIMMFMGLTSGYIVAKGGAKFWVHIVTPRPFWISAIVMIASSITMIIATRSAKKGNKSLMNTMLVTSLLLAGWFFYSQYQGWMEMNEKGLYFTGNFLEHLDGEYGKDYHITDQEGNLINLSADGHYYDPEDPEKDVDEELKTFKNKAATWMLGLALLHALHVAGGLLYLIYLVIMGLLGRVGAERPLPVAQGATYWHFVDVLWLYLLLFLHFIH